ncbi:MAG: hypothetical protein K9G33_09000 [Sneathiella sp.]|nr:hypothetical protein [Sneathiella sp.]
MRDSSIAQTNIQLIEQLQNQNFLQEDLEKISDACDFMGELAAGGYRATGRPFYNHLIGAASIIARETSDISLICAELLHSSYDFGRFARWIFPPTFAQKRKVIARRAGPEVERYIYLYHEANWPQVLSPENIEEYSPEKKSVILMRVADMLEDFIEDKGPIRANKISLWPLNDIANPVELLARVSEKIGARWIAEQYRQLSQKPARKILQRSNSITYFITPWKFKIPAFLRSFVRWIRHG